MRRLILGVSTALCLSAPASFAAPVEINSAEPLFVTVNGDMPQVSVAYFYSEAGLKISLNGIAVLENLPKGQKIYGRFYDPRAKRYTSPWQDLKLEREFEKVPEMSSRASDTDGGSDTIAGIGVQALGALIATGAAPQVHAATQTSEPAAEVEDPTRAFAYTAEGAAALNSLHSMPSLVFVVSADRENVTHVLDLRILCRLAPMTFLDGTKGNLGCQPDMTVLRDLI